MDALLQSDVKDWHVKSPGNGIAFTLVLGETQTAEAKEDWGSAYW